MAYCTDYIIGWLTTSGAYFTAAYDTRHHYKRCISSVIKYTKYLIQWYNYMPQNTHDHECTTITTNYWEIVWYCLLCHVWIWLGHLLPGCKKKAADRLMHRTLILHTGVLITLDNYQSRHHWDDQTTIVLISCLLNHQLICISWYNC